MHTGDAAHMDEQGYVYIVDRMKDMLRLWRRKRLLHRGRKRPSQTPGRRLVRDHRRARYPVG